MIPPSRKGRGQGQDASPRREADTASRLGGAVGISGRARLSGEQGLIRPESKQELLYTGSLPTASGIAPSIESQGPIYGFAQWADPEEVNATRLRDKHLLDQMDATVQEYKTGRRPNSWKPRGTGP